jgi:hypothetical protein
MDDQVFTAGNHPESGPSSQPLFKLNIPPISPKNPVKSINFEENTLEGVLRFKSPTSES